jgi:hypothetical protein
MMLFLILVMLGLSHLRLTEDTEFGVAIGLLIAGLVIVLTGWNGVIIKRKE